MDHTPPDAHDLDSSPAHRGANAPRPQGALSFGAMLVVGLVPWLARALHADVEPGALGFGTALALLGVAGLIRTRRHSAARTRHSLGP